MSVLINHAILGATDKLGSARFFCDLFDLAEPEEAGPFAVARLSSGELVQFATPRYNHGGRGVYFLDPSGNYLEAITAPYAD